MGNPTSLHTRSLLFVTLLLPVFAEESGYGLDRLLRVHLSEITSWLSSLHELGDGPRPQGIVLTRDATLVLRSVISELLCGRVLR